MRLVEQTLEIGDLDFGGAAHLVGVLLGVLANLAELDLGVAADVGGGRLGGLRHRPGALVGGRADDILRQRTQV